MRELPHAGARLLVGSLPKGFGMQRIQRLAVAPVMRIWLASQRYANQSTPRPTDAPSVHAEGSDSHRVLIFGSGPAMGWGVISHEIALPGFLARALSSRTDRGAAVDVVANMKFNASTALNAVRGLESRNYDAIVVVLGPNDAVPLTALSKWRTGLSRVLAHLDRERAPHAQIIVTGVPPIPSVPGFGTRLGAIAASHAAQMNLATERLCQSSTHTTFVPLSSAPDVAPGVRDGRIYRHWANEIADALAAQLEAPGQDKTVADSR